MAYTFFQATHDALSNITETFDFVHPLRASLRFTRKKVLEISIQTPNACNTDFQEAIDPDGEIHGVAYKSAYISTPLDYQEEQLAWILLNNLFAIYEGWAQRIYAERFESRGYAEKTFVKNLQFPGLQSKFSTYFAPSGKQSPIMNNAYFDAYKSVSRLDFSKLENYLVLYRYFKEARNCYMHHNFTASQAVVDAYNAFSVIATPSQLDAAEVPVIISPVVGEKVHLSLRGVIGFSQFVRRILIISDTYLIKTSAAEEEFLSRKPADWKMRTLSSTLYKAKGQITKYSSKVGLVKPVYSTDYQQFLLTHGIFSR